MGNKAQRHNMKKATIILTVIVAVVSSLAYAEVSKEHYKSGKLKMERSLKDGKAEGVSRSYYESGQLKIEIYFNNGRPEGPIK
ncbi:MAG: hypothetical protein GY800_00520, partial [Planctomycetes bacterium]|nr:hypothetical protein [Planctomycetota bacterium]